MPQKGLILKRNGTNMKIITWNVNGIRAAAGKGLFEFLEKQKPDYFCLQETKAHPQQLGEAYMHPQGYQSYWSTAEKKGFSGTVIYARETLKEVSHGIGIRKFDREGRFVICRTKRFSLYNVYFPNGGMNEARHLYKQDFLKKFQRHLQRELKEREVILVGDYNVAYLPIDVYDPKKLSTVSGYLPEEREWFNGFLAAGFIDVYRHFYPKKDHVFTWWSMQERARPLNNGWRIDHVCVSRKLIDKVKKITILDEQEGSDHCPVSVELEM